MEFEKEDRIRKGKDKKLSKHFEGVINDVKIKFLNFRFKTLSPVLSSLPKDDLKVMNEE